MTDETPERLLPRWQAALRRAYAAGNYEDPGVTESARLLAAYMLLEAAKDVLRNTGPLVTIGSADDPYHH